jgi:hypothetical protein
VPGCVLVSLSCQWQRQRLLCCVVVCSTATLPGAWDAVGSPAFFLTAACAVLVLRTCQLHGFCISCFSHCEPFFMLLFSSLHPGPADCGAAQGRASTGQPRP